jgi:hypothetical protein
LDTSASRARLICSSARDALGGVELVEDVPALLDEQRDEAVAGVVGAHAGQSDGLAGAPPDVAMPRLPVGVVPDSTAGAWEDERVVVRAA